ncbi:MAG: hypothetical protein V4509_00460 [Patescibacteria group bacterium]
MKKKVEKKVENKTGNILVQEDYTIEVKYSPEAVEKKMMRFSAKNDTGVFEISSEEMINFLMNQVNMDELKPTFVDTEKVNVVQVQRQIVCVINEDMKKGQTVRLNYTHPYPLEFAIIEEAYKIAKIELLPGAVALTKEFIDGVKTRIKPEMDGFAKKFYKSFKQIDLGVEPKK